MPLMSSVPLMAQASMPLAQASTLEIGGYASRFNVTDLSGSCPKRSFLCIFIEPYGSAPHVAKSRN